MQEKNCENKPMLVTRVSKLAIFGTLTFVELSVKLMAGAVILASAGIKKILGKNES